MDETTTTLFLVSCRLYSMSDRFAAPKKTKKLRKTVLKVNTDKKDEYIFFLEYVILHYQKNAFTVFENLKKSLIQHYERSELCLH